MTKKRMPKCGSSHLRLKGKVIGIDDNGVMVSLEGGAYDTGMYVPYLVLGDLPIYGSTVDVEVTVDTDGKSMSLTMKLEDADQT